MANSFLTTRERSEAKKIVQEMEPSQREAFISRFSQMSPSDKAVATRRLIRARGSAALTGRDVGEILFKNFIEASEKTGQTALGLVEGLTGGIPRELLESGTELFLPPGEQANFPRGSVEGRLIGTVSPGGIVGRTGRAILSTLPGRSVGQRVGRELLAGFTGGTLATPLGEGGLQGRVLQGAVGSLIGGATIGGFKIVEGISKSIKADQLAIKAKDALIAFKRSRGVRRQKTGVPASDAIIRAKNRVKQAGEEAINAEQQVVARTNQALSRQLTDQVNDVATKVKDPLNRSLKQVSIRYGNRLDDAIDVAEATTPNSAFMTPDEVLRVQRETLGELDDMGINFPRIEQIIQQTTKRLIGRQPQQTVSEAVRGIQPRSNISLKEVARERKSLNKLLSTGAKEGTKRFDPEEVAIAIYNKRLGNEIKNRVNVSDLNQTYSDTVDLMKFVYRNFRTKTGDIDIKAGSRLLKNLGLGKLDAGDIRAINRIQKGNDLFPGVGDFTKNIRQTGAQISKLKETSAIQLAQSKRVLQRRISGLQKKAEFSQRRGKQVSTELQVDLETLENMAKGIRTAQRLGTRAAIVLTEGLAAIGLYKMIFDGGGR